MRFSWYISVLHIFMNVAASWGFKQKRPWVAILFLLYHIWSDCHSIPVLCRMQLVYFSLSGLCFIEKSFDPVTEGRSGLIVGKSWLALTVKQGSPDGALVPGSQNIFWKTETAFCWQCLGIGMWAVYIKTLISTPSISMFMWEHWGFTRKWLGLIFLRQTAFSFFPAYPPEASPTILCLWYLVKPNIMTLSESHLPR